MATSLHCKEQQNKFAQLLFKTHMSYSDTEENQTSLINLHFQKCLQKVNFIQAIIAGFYVIIFILKLHSSIPNALSVGQWSSIAEKLKLS